MKNPSQVVFPPHGTEAEVIVRYKVNGEDVEFNWKLKNVTKLENEAHFEEAPEGFFVASRVGITTLSITGNLAERTQTDTEETAK